MLDLTPVQVDASGEAGVSGGSSDPTATPATTAAAAAAKPPKPTFGKKAGLSQAKTKTVGGAGAVKAPAASKAAAAVAAKTTKTKGTAGATAEKKAKPAKESKIKGPKNAFMFFSAAKRDELKAEHKDWSLGDTSKHIGELWKGLTEEEKQPYVDQAAADKERVKAEKAEAGEAEPATSKKAKADKKDKQPCAKSAYNFFCDANRDRIKAENPGAGFGEQTKALAQAWKDASEEDKAKYNAMNEEEKAKLPAKPAKVRIAAKKAGKKRKADASDDDEEEEEAAEEGHQDNADGDHTTEAAQSRAKPAGTSTAARAACTTSAVPEEQQEDEAERMEVDWEAHPAEMIIAHTAGAQPKYLVKRQGLSFMDYGLVDARAAKRQRLVDPNAAEGSAAKPFPVSLEMVDEYEAYQASFRQAIHSNTESGELILDDIAAPSPLELCFLLGQLQQPTYQLSPANDSIKRKQDRLIKVPMQGISMVVQRLVMAERKAAQSLLQEKSEELERLKGELDVLNMMVQANDKGKAAAEE
ncbi:hypothetical protein WJX72_012067 [[Myrmecia] bisecta]|uniref:HMG box domain-containing protein n=1 Tax=[Myrmecia] bisecta TaxID=41462 RepID=A0AAW1QSZ3_9CHLO